MSQIKGIQEIINTIKYHKKLKTDKEVAKALGLTPNALGQHKKRNSTPLKEIIEFCHKEGIDITEMIFESKEGENAIKLVKGLEEREVKGAKEEDVEIGEIITYLKKNEKDRKLILELIRSKKRIRNLINSISEG